MTTGILEEAVMALLKLNNNRDRIRGLYEAMSPEEVAERREPWQMLHLSKRRCCSDNRSHLVLQKIPYERNVAREFHISFWCTGL
jgi:hypothetical protein